MILGENIGSVFNEGREIRRVYSLGKLVWEKLDYSVIPFTVKAIADTVSISFTDGDKNVVGFKYSLNGEDWQNTDEIIINKNDIVSIISTDAAYSTISGLSDIYGNIMSLIYGDDYINQTVWKEGLANYGSSNGFFKNCDIRIAENLILPATTLTKSCYRSMFWSCDSLELPPKLPATTLANYCYASMFHGCEKLKVAPKLPATTLTEHCYNSMFRGCNNLTTAPKLPATTLAVGCYASMFHSCNNLTTAPELPATTLANNCYNQMFFNCDNLTTAPELPATTLVKECYHQMFRYCYSLEYIKCLATDFVSGYLITFDSCVSGFTDGVKTNGTLVCKQVNGGKNPLEDYIPSTWTVEYLT